MTPARKALQEAIKRAGGMRSLARVLGLSHQAIGGWEKAPQLRVLQIERLTGVSRHMLRPDLYSPEEVKPGGDKRSHHSANLRNDCLVENRLYNRAEVAEWLGILPATVDRLTRRGMLPYVSVGAGAVNVHRRYTGRMILDFIAQRTQAPAIPTPLYEPLRPLRRGVSPTGRLLERYLARSDCPKTGTVRERLAVLRQIDAGLSSGSPVRSFRDFLAARALAKAKP